MYEVGDSNLLLFFSFFFFFLSLLMLSDVKKEGKRQGTFGGVDD